MQAPNNWCHTITHVKVSHFNFVSFEPCRKCQYNDLKFGIPSIRIDNRSIVNLNRSYIPKCSRPARAPAGAFRRMPTRWRPTISYASPAIPSRRSAARRPRGPHGRGHLVGRHRAPGARPPGPSGAASGRFAGGPLGAASGRGPGGTLGCGRRAGRRRRPWGGSCFRG